MKSLPSPPSKQVDAVAAEEGVVPCPPSTVILIRAARLPVAEKRVVATVHVEHEVLGGADVDAERCGIDAVEADAGAVGGRR